MQLSVNQYIEHTNLSPLITSAQVEQLIDEAITYQFCGICVPPYWVKKARRDVGKANIQVVTVIGFPLGYQRSEIKLREMESAVRDGADELDIKLNISAVKNNALEWVKIELAQFSKFAHEREKIVKVILETAYLTETELRETCKVCIDTGVDFLKTSSGFAPAGAQLDTVRLMRSLAPESVGIKASGGIKTYEQALSFIQAGAERIGTSAGIQIMQQAPTH